jgi:transaldolase
MNNIQALKAYGQSIWLDFISRGLLDSGELKNLVDQGVTGVTSNPSIFQKSICETHDYDNLLTSVQKAQPQADVQQIYEKMAVEDIQMACDVLRPVYDSTDGADGFVSFEVSPHLAHDTSTTISEAQRLWKLVSRPNLMIKVPATPEGIPAVEALVRQGLNINITLIFSLKQYQDTAQAYMRGLEGVPNPRRVASVASFFVSRIDTAVDKLLEKNGGEEALALRGKIAVDCSRLIYRDFSQIFYSAPFEKMRSQGARVQKIVWGSTGTKNPKYSDVLYLDEIIGPDTINTVPMATLKAFLDHGRPQQTITKDVDRAEKEIKSLSKLGVDLNAVTTQLENEGVAAFSQAFDQMIESLKGRCSAP